MTQDRIFAASSDFIAQANIDADTYQQKYRQSVESPDVFWADVAKRLDWFRFPTKIKDVSFDADDLHIRWFEDGQLNLSVNCLDRHLETRGDKTAIIWEGDTPDESEHITYRDLHARVCRLANAMRNLGIGKGDRVTIYRATAGTTPWSKASRTPASRK